MKWKKLGLIYAPTRSSWWNQLYAMMPTPVYLGGSTIRVYFGTTDAEKFGRTSFIDFDLKLLRTVSTQPERIVLDIGKPGTFDDSGVVPSSIVNVAKEQYLYYVGFQRVQKVPYMLFSGLAISDISGNFKRYVEAPIIDRSSHNIYSNAAPFVMYDQQDGIFKMWYWLGKQWVTVNEKLYLNAEIHYATSIDGKSWQLNQQPCIVPDGINEFSVGRPWIIKEHGIYKMYYSVRYNDRLYRLGYAESRDGTTWERKDEEIGIDVSESGWDSEMICYPSVITVDEKTYMFYNGNNNGETGFGIAELIGE